MRGAVPLARRNLLRQRVRFALSAGGVGLALLLVLTLGAVFAGVKRDVTAYVDNVGAGVVVSQRGVKTMHMSSSAVPLSVLSRIRSSPGVARAAPILFTSLVLNGRNSVFSYLIGYRPGEGGGPWNRVAGAARPGPGGVILDEVAAERLGVEVGDRLRITGRALRVDGLTKGTVSIVSSSSFVDYGTFAAAAGSRGSASYVLVWPRDGTSSAALARELQARLPDETVQTAAQFAAQERALVTDMTLSLIQVLSLVGFVVGVAVAGLSVYTGTVARMREYAVLRALGLPGRGLLGLVARQAAITVAAGYLVALVLLGLVALVIARAAPTVSLALTPGNLLTAALVTALIAAAAALFPARRLTRVDPASVYRT